MQDRSNLENVLSVTSTLPTMAARQKDQRVVFASCKRGREKVVSHWDNCRLVCLCDSHFYISSPSCSTKYYATSPKSLKWSFVVLLIDTYVILIIGPQPCLCHQYGEAEGSAGIGRGKYRSFHLFLINCKCPVDQCSNLQVLEDPAGNICNCNCYIFSPVLKASESMLWKPCRWVDDCISEEGAGIVYRDVRWCILFMNIGLLTDGCYCLWKWYGICYLPWNEKLHHQCKRWISTGPTGRAVSLSVCDSFTLQSRWTSAG